MLERESELASEICFLKHFLMYLKLKAFLEERERQEIMCVIKI